MRLNSILMETTRSLREDVLKACQSAYKVYWGGGHLCPSGYDDLHTCWLIARTRTLSRCEALRTGYPGSECDVETCPSYRHEGLWATVDCRQGIRSRFVLGEVRRVVH